MRIEYADVTLQGGRGENQDRVAVAASEHAALLMVVDGMGGYADGGRAAEVTRKTVLDAFRHAAQPLFDPLGFLHLTLGRAHEAVVKLGEHSPIDQRPRATCALCLVQQGASWWAHIGDSRIYHVRGGKLIGRSRDHSHVEGLLREGLITAEQAQAHPMRNYVECCLGGGPILPDMALTRRRPLEAGDALLVCSDGLWGPLKDEELAGELGAPTTPLRDKLLDLARRSVRRAGAGSDNTSAAALRWLGD
ncbi:MAG: PP2C family protein-serine/threonine phosphatase [Steroidobacteraceae bacterium]